MVTRKIAPIGIKAEANYYVKRQIKRKCILHPKRQTNALLFY